MKYNRAMLFLIYWPAKSNFFHYLCYYSGDQIFQVDSQYHFIDFVVRASLNHLNKRNVHHYCLVMDLGHHVNWLSSKKSLRVENLNRNYKYMHKGAKAAEFFLKMFINNCIDLMYWLGVHTWCSDLMYWFGALI